MEQKEKNKIYWKAIFKVTEKEKEIISATEELFKSMEEDFEALHAYSVLSAIRETKKNNQEEITILREQLRGTREELSDQRNENERLKGMIKEATAFIEKNRKGTPGMGALLAILGKFQTVNK